ncbi:MAG: hypothetical protein JW891_07555 [Candidatus Lokiarchaeota archaeon]|nr:hypothetical protein [Candidatus Lokiarchaeota archaeon]
MDLTKKKLYEATDSLINQQFYYSGRDLIIGRTPDISIKISKSGQIVHKFKNLFKKNLHFFIDGKYFQFLLPFKIILGIEEQDIKEIVDNVEFKLNNLDSDNTFDILITYTMVLSAFISRIRDIHFNRALDLIKKRVMQKVDIESDKIQERLDNLFMKNNKNVSILYNLSYIDALADSFNYKKVARTCKIQKGKFVNKIVMLIISGKN